MKILACFAIPAIAILTIGTVSVAGGCLMLCLDKGIGILGLIILAVACWLVAKACNVLHRLFLFVGSVDRTTINRPARRIAGTPIERA